MQVDPSHFECEDCGARSRSTAIPYGPLGYPICPDCGACAAPRA